MAHFAELDENNIVKTVIVIHNNELLDENGIEQEQNGIDFCKFLYGEDTKWIQTSYNASTNRFRKNYAGIGYIYDPIRDAFYLQQPYPSWVLNEDTCIWEAPVPMPEHDPTNQLPAWNEETQSWFYE